MRASGLTPSKRSISWMPVKACLPGLEVADAPAAKALAEIVATLIRLAGEVEPSSDGARKVLPAPAAYIIATSTKGIQ